MRRAVSAWRAATRSVVAAALSWMFLVPVIAQSKVDVKFGILVTGSDGRVAFVETTRVPNTVGQHYGWIATIEPQSEATFWTEELKLPTPPKVWDAPAEISRDRTAARTNGVLQPNEGEFSSFWEITAGDPNGTYSLVLKLSDGVIAEFTFEVIEP